MNPKPAQLKKLIKHAREKGTRVIFVQPQFSTKSANLIAAELTARRFLQIRWQKIGRRTCAGWPAS